MWITVLLLVISLAIILISCELFTNGIEWFGKKLKLGDGVVGSILSAVGTCLPETLVPIIAILFTNGSQDYIDIGIGAIAGAPFMLSTLAFFVTGISVLIFWKKRKTGMAMKVNNKILSRDIGFFIIVYSLGISATFIGNTSIKYIVAAFLIACYVYYVYLTAKEDTHVHTELEKLIILKYVKAEPTLPIIVFQIALALSGIILGANSFVTNMEHISGRLGISALILSLIITPVATELPEKFNSIIWISKKKDTLALGNISGAMVFQSCIPVAIGIVTTAWVLNKVVIVSAILAVVSSISVFLWIKIKGKLSPIPLLLSGIFYIIYIVYIFKPF